MTDSSQSSTISGGLLAICLSLAALGAYFLFKHHDMKTRNYTAGSVCEHRYDRKYSGILPGHVTGDVDKDGNDDWQRGLEAEQSRGDEFTAVLSGLRVANDAIIARKLSGLFCLPQLSKLEEAKLYTAYWDDAETRIEDPVVCRRDYPADILAYVVAKYPCPNIASASVAQGGPSAHAQSLQKK